MKKFFLLIFIFINSCVFTRVLEHPETLESRLLNTSYKDVNYDIVMLSKIELLDDYTFRLNFQECQIRYKFQYDEYYAKEKIHRIVIDENGDINYYFFFVSFFVEHKGWVEYTILSLVGFPLFVFDMASLYSRTRGSVRERNYKTETTLSHKSGTVKCNPNLKIKYNGEMYTVKDCMLDLSAEKLLKTKDWKQKFQNSFSFNFKYDSYMNEKYRHSLENTINFQLRELTFTSTYYCSKIDK